MEAAREAIYYEVLDAGVTLQEAADELLEEAASGLHSGDAPKEPIPMGVNDVSGGTKASAEEGREWKRRARVINDRPNEQRTRKTAKWGQRRDLHERQARVDTAPKAAQRASGEGPVEEGEIEPRSRRKRRKKNKNSSSSVSAVELTEIEPAKGDSQTDMYSSDETGGDREGGRGRVMMMRSSC